MEQLTTPELLQLLQDHAARKKVISAEEKQIKELLFERYKLTINDALAKKDEPFGTVHLDGFSIDIPKTVAWDQDKLAEIYSDILHEGSNPAEYIDLKYSISETKYKAWPEVIYKQFEPARTVKPGTVAVKVEE